MKENISLVSCLFTALEHVSCHITHCKESHWMKRKCFKTIRDGSKSWIEFTFFFEPLRSILFRAREQVNRSRVKDISREQLKPFRTVRTVKKNRSGYSP